MCEQSTLVAATVCVGRILYVPARPVPEPNDVIYVPGVNPVPTQIAPVAKAPVMVGDAEIVITVPDIDAEAEVTVAVVIGERI